MGRWRVFDQGLPIDAKGSLPDGTIVNRLEDLEAGILKRPEMFVGTLCEKLLTFALGRGVDLHDAPAIRKVVSQSVSNRVQRADKAKSPADEDYRFSSLIYGIVTSAPFQMRMVE